MSDKWELKYIQINLCFQSKIYKYFLVRRTNINFRQLN